MYDSGQAKGLARFNDGKLEGPYTTWRENGQKKGEGFYKDGKMEGLCIEWYASGQKRLERTFKDGKRDGPLTFWRESGQKAEEGIFKDGEKVSAKYWNSKSEEVETWEEAEGKPKPVPPRHIVPLLPADAPDSLNTPGQGEED